MPTADAARRIFTVLNARGLDLTAADILKADLLDRAGPAAEELLAKRWEAAELLLGRDTFGELFGHIRMIYEREKPRSALETAFAKVVPPFNGDAESFVRGVLEPTADAYSLLSDRAGVKAEFGRDAGRAIRSLHRVDNKDWLPPALLRLQRCQSGDGLMISKFLIDLERLTYFLFLTRADVNERIARFAGVLDEIDPRPGKGAVVGGLQLAEGEKVAFRAALDGPLYRKSRVCRPVLQRLDETLSTGEADYEEAVLSIEHVLPQTVQADGEWATAFPDDRIRAEWTHRLANLVLLNRRLNSSASNWPFERKKNEYFKGRDGATPFRITQEVQATADWTPMVLESRQANLTARLATLWRL